MAIKVTFPTGSNTVTVNGLYQWDYGQVLEIESADLPVEYEVHFACPNMNEALVHSCSAPNGVGTVTIPDVCLEQTGTITAWVYVIDGTLGRTVKTINLPITARTRPNRSDAIPQGYSDKYTELITEVNEAIGALREGDVVVAQATNAQTANHATTAGNASTASYATSAGSAATAGNADWATRANYTTIPVSGNGVDSLVLPNVFGVYAVILINRSTDTPTMITDLLFVDNPVQDWETEHLYYFSNERAISAKSLGYKIYRVAQIVSNN